MGAHRMLGPATTRGLCSGLLLVVTWAVSPVTALADDPVDTVYLVGGGRVRGVIMMNDKSGVYLRLADGSTRDLPRNTIERVEYANGHRGPAPAPRPAPDPSPDAGSDQPRRVNPHPASAEDAIDTVFLVGGGRVRGVVMMNDKTGVYLRLADGSTRDLPRNTIDRVEYASSHRAPRPPPSKSRGPETETTNETRTPTAVGSVREVPLARSAPSNEPADDEAPEGARSPSERRDDSSSDPPDAEPNPELSSKRSTANGMVVSGAVLTSIGWTGFIAGAVAISVGLVGNNDGGNNVIGGVAMASGGVIGITGSVLLGVGMRKLRKLPDEPPARSEMRFRDTAFVTAPLTLTLSF